MEQWLVTTEDPRERAAGAGIEDSEYVIKVMKTYSDEEVAPSDRPFGEISET